MKNLKRHNPNDRKALILRAAILVARRSNYAEITRNDVAEVADVAPSLVTHYFGTVEKLREAVMQAAVETSEATIVAQGLARGDALARNAPSELKEAAAKALAAR